MTQIIGGALLLAIVVLGWWNQVLGLRNAQLTSALAARSITADDGVVCREIVRQAERGDYVAMLQAATQLAERHGPHATARAGR